MALPEGTDEAALGEILLGLVEQAHDLGIDPEAALRRATRGLIERIQHAEKRKGLSAPAAAQ